MSYSPSIEGWILADSNPIEEAAVVLNAGGRAADALKHLMVLETLAGGIETVIIVHHTGKSTLQNRCDGLAA